MKVMPTRIAYVVNSLNPGGTEKLVVEMSLSLSREFELEVFCLDEPGSWAATLRGNGVPVTCLWRQPGLDLSMPSRLAGHLRRMRADIVHAHQCTPWFYAALSRFLYPASRLLLEEHGRFYPEEDKPIRRLVNRIAICPMTSRFVAVSNDIRSRLERYEGVRRAAVEVVYNGVSSPPPLDIAKRQQLRAQFGFDDSHFVVGTVGRFDPIKNLDMLIDSMAIAAGDHPELRGLLVGNGPEFARVDSLLRQRGLQDHLVLAGYRSDAQMIVQCMDLFALSSLSEGTSMALLEAMAAGVPVAVTAVGGNPEIVTDGQTGWVVPSGGVTELGRVIGEAISDARLRASHGAAGKREIRTRFTFDGMRDQYRRIYGEMVGRIAADLTRSQ
jgi:glycosyltransferase involved in cell wall biosynthesis